jgi:membrane associated rhomboid family serine protease
MSYKSSFHLAPSQTPLYLKLLLLATAICSLLSAWLIPYLSLSLTGIEKGMVWQLATYVLVHPFPIGIFQLILNLYLIWTFGASLAERLHATPFLIFYFGSAIFAGGCALATMLLTHSIAPLLGSNSVLLALLISWMILNSNAELLLFFTLPLKANRLVLGFIAITFILHISNAQWIPLAADIGSILFAYLFTLINCRSHSHFSFLLSFENKVLRTLEKLSSFSKKTYEHTKLYDIKSKSPLLNDDAFMDAMLAKISLKGEDSLTAEEKKRMDQISKRKGQK